jgi:hypothetical protein
MRFCPLRIDGDCVLDLSAPLFQVRVPRGLQMLRRRRGLMVAIAIVVSLCVLLLINAPRERNLGSGPTRMNRLRYIGMASWHWSSEHSGRLVVQEAPASAGEPTQSWATRLLPYIELADLYERIDGSVGWDDPVNREWYGVEVDEFFNPAFCSADEATNAAGYALSHFAANRRVAESKSITDQDGISRADGSSNTLMYGEAAGRFKPWGQPGNWRDPAEGINASPDGFGGPDDGAMFVFCDNHVRFIASDIDPTVLRALATPDGGESVESSSF